MSNIGEFLKEERMKRLLSQDDMAKLLELSRNSYRYIERGLRQPKLSTQRRIAKVLSVECSKIRELCKDV